ncbi:hypothetical protein [Algoriphagus sp.]|uniref:hypothetical protein n=1 Tax=Algoriphagus sp. TaxID=1872435 RepID=UPI002630A072|nr:hypothetical protein [Algoriphagus sp.]
MHTYSEKKGKFSDTPNTQVKGDSQTSINNPFQFIDNRGDTLVQRKFRNLVDSKFSIDGERGESEFPQKPLINSIAPVQSVFQLAKIIGYYHTNPIVQFEGEEEDPVDGSLENDLAHNYVSPPRGFEGERVYLKIPKEEPAEEEMVQFGQAKVNEALSGLLSFLQSLKTSIKTSPNASTPYLKAIYADNFQKIKEIKSESAKIKNDYKKLMQTTLVLGHMLNTITGLVKSILVSPENDREIGGMTEEEYSKSLHDKESDVGKRQETGLGVIHLFEGGLPSGTIEIIGSFYRADFDVESLVLRTDVESILQELVLTEENRLREHEEQRSIKKSERKFYKVEEDVARTARQVLRETSKASAEIQASKRSVTPKLGGQLRSWHLNDTGMLPRTFLKGQHNDTEDKKSGKISSGFSNEAKKGLLEDSSFVYKAQEQLHALWQEDVKVGGGFQPGYIDDFPRGAENFRKEASQIEPGYIEVNPEGWIGAESQGRLLYDYISDRWFLTTDHYHEHFWEIYVPSEYKTQILLDSSGEELIKSAIPKLVGEPKNESSNSDLSFDRYAMNNCLIDAIAEAAHFPDPNIQLIREELDSLGLGSVGEMLYADQAIVELIARNLNLNGVPIILYDVNGNAQELVGGDAPQIIEIFHTGALHYVANPANKAQRDATKKN